MGLRVQRVETRIERRSGERGVIWTMKFLRDLRYLRLSAFLIERPARGFDNQSKSICLPYRSWRFQDLKRRTNENAEIADFVPPESNRLDLPEFAPVGRRWMAHGSPERDAHVLVVLESGPPRDLDQRQVGFRSTDTAHVRFGGA